MSGRIEGMAGRNEIMLYVDTVSMKRRNEGVDGRREG